MCICTNTQFILQFGGNDNVVLILTLVVFTENEIDGDTFVNLTENMIVKIFPKMKDQVKFMRLQ